MHLISDYMEQEESAYALRVNAVYIWFSFEKWYKAGCLEGEYIPFSYDMKDVLDRVAGDYACVIFGFTPNDDSVNFSRK